MRMVFGSLLLGLVSGFMLLAALRVFSNKLERHNAPLQMSPSEKRSQKGARPECVPSFQYKQSAGGSPSPTIVLTFVLDCPVTCRTSTHTSTAAAALPHHMHTTYAHAFARTRPACRLRAPRASAHRRDKKHHGPLRTPPSPSVVVSPAHTKASRPDGAVIGRRRMAFATCGVGRS